MKFIRVLDQRFGLLIPRSAFIAPRSGEFCKPEIQQLRA
jgi:hypothetical protein